MKKNVVNNYQHIDWQRCYIDLLNLQQQLVRAYKAKDKNKKPPETNRNQFCCQSFGSPTSNLK